ncbi:11264_t:CDS:2, partial [Racocetra persica]
NYRDTSSGLVENQKGSISSPVLDHFLVFIPARSSKLGRVFWDSFLAEKNIFSSDKKADKQKNLTQALFDYVVEEAEALVASTSGISETSKTSNLPEPKIVERSQKDQLKTSKLSKPIELISDNYAIDDTESEESDFEPETSDSSKPQIQASSSSQTIEMDSMLAEIDA